MSSKSERQTQAIQRRKRERELLGRASEALRHSAAMAQYAGLEKRERAYALASILDVLALHWTDVLPPLRDQAVIAAEELLGIAEQRGRESTKPRSARTQL